MNIWRQQVPKYISQERYMRTLILTLRRPNLLGLHVPVSPDLAKTVKVRLDQSENLTKVFGGANNGNFS